MIYSMTGYGKAEKDFPNKKISVEIKSLNSKYSNISIKLPHAYREWEIELQQLLLKHLKRGKVNMIVDEKKFVASSNISIDRALAKKYFEELKILSNDIGEIEFHDYLPLLLKMPDVVKAENETIDEESKSQVFDLVKEAIEHLNQYREKEGKALSNDFEKRNNEILHLLGDVSILEKERRVVVRENLERKLKEWTQNIDQERLEQEMIYYIEKLDITEEIVRLQENCKGFSETMQSSPPQGKKLGFIAQEIGREINTIGSKANHSEMQKNVVLMKDELEKIKEQLANVL